jgi:hypothetical protein
MDKTISIQKGGTSLVFSGKFEPYVPGSRDVPEQKAQFEPDAVYLDNYGRHTSLTQVFNDLMLWEMFDEELQQKADNL